MSFPSNGPIAPLTRKHVEPLGERRLPSCWVYTPRRGRIPAPTLAPFSTGAERVGPDFVQEAPLALMLGATPPDAAMQALLDAAEQSGARVYVLAGPDFGEGRRDPGLRDLRRASVLVRRLSHAPPCSAILARRGERARVWLGHGEDKAPTHSLWLSPSQGDALFRVFLYLFWHEAKEEASTGEGPLRFREAAERPFDALPPGARASVRLLARDEGRFEGSSGDTVYDPLGLQGLSNASAFRIAFTPASASSGHDKLVGLAKGGAQIVWEDLALPPFLVGEIGGAMEMGAGPYRLRFALESEQARVLRQLAHTAADVASFRFHHDAQLGRLSGEVWLPQAPAPQPIVASQPIDAGIAIADEIRRMPDTPARSLPEPSPLALSATYHWSVHPPRVPIGAKEDPLVESWRVMDARAKAELDRLEKRLDAIDKHASTLQRFAALAGRLLGFGRARSAQRGTLADLGKALPSALGPEETRALFGRIAELDEDLSKHEAELRKEERNAEDEEAKERQKLEYEEKQAQARKALSIAREERSAEEARLDKAIEALASQEFPDEKQRKESEKKLRFHSEKTLKDIDAKIRALQADLDKPFEFVPPRRTESAKTGTKGGGGVVAKLVPAGTSNVDIPREALPRVGALRRAKDGRYLVITRWEDLDLGEAEARRLGARLVAPEEGK